MFIPVLKRKKVLHAMPYVRMFAFVATVILRGAQLTIVRTSISMGLMFSEKKNIAILLFKNNADGVR